MSGMIERAAKAIYEGRNGHGCKPWSLLTKAHKKPYLKDAQAAISAARPFIENESLEGMTDKITCRVCGIKAYRTGYGCEVCDCDVNESARKPSQVQSWNGGDATLAWLLQSLDTYSELMPGAVERAQWIMKQAAKVIRVQIADMADGSWFKEADIDALVARAETAEAEVQRLTTDPASTEAEIIGYITNSEGPSPNLRPVKKREPMRCTLCGGLVDLTNAVRPEGHAGPGGKP